MRYVNSTLGFVAIRDPEDRLLNIKLAGGTVLDLGVYNNALTQWVYNNNPAKIHAFGHIGETDVDESISVSYAYTNGVSAQYACIFEVQPRNQLVINGSKGRIILHTSFVVATEATLEKDGRSKTVKKPFKINGFEYQIMASMDAIRSGKLECSQMTQSDTLTNMRTLDIIREQIGMKYPFE